jgi:hypothetical protein
MAVRGRLARAIGASHRQSPAAAYWQFVNHLTQSSSGMLALSQIIDIYEEPCVVKVVGRRLGSLRALAPA